MFEFKKYMKILVFIFLKGITKGEPIMGMGHFYSKIFYEKNFYYLKFFGSLYCPEQGRFLYFGLLGVNSTTMNATTGTSAYSYGEGMSFSFDLDISFGFRFGILFNDHVSAGVHLQRYTSKTFIVKKEIRHLSAPDCLFQNSCEIVNSKYDYHFTFNNFLAEFTYYINKVDENGFWISGLLGVPTLTAAYASKVFSSNRGGIEAKISHFEKKV